jgi:hypothetical protein
MSEIDTSKPQYWSMELWEKLKEENAWVLPEKAVWWKRLPVIRRIRYTYLYLQVEKQARMFAQAGIGFGFIHRRDEWVLYAISRGLC